MEPRAATTYSGGHSDDVDYVAWNPTHPELFCTSSQKDKRIVFWDARRTCFREFTAVLIFLTTITESRYIQQVPLKVSPVQVNYAPDGKSLLYVSGGNSLFFMTYGTTAEEIKPEGKSAPLKEWQVSDRDTVRPGSTAIFNHLGDGVIVTHHQEHTLRVMDYPSLTVRESPAAHVGGCIAVALDPRGKYLASGGADSIVNIFDLNDWICARTITVCECVPRVFRGVVWYVFDRYFS